MASYTELFSSEIDTPERGGEVPEWNISRASEVGEQNVFLRQVLNET